ncbi:MAG: hypothetical protein ABGX05_02720 [Pirellulaceae bacterium]
MIEPRAADIPPARFILCERRGPWAIALVRAVPPIRDVLYETRSMRQAWEALQQSPDSFLGLELTGDNFESVACSLKQLSRDYPRARAVILTGRSLQHYEWILRESGAVDFLVSPRRLRLLATMANRHIVQVGSDSTTVNQTIWQRLPWRPRHDTNETTRARDKDR